MPKSIAAIERFAAKVQKTEDCWLWLAGLSSSGYGIFSDRGRMNQAHRWYYIHLFGEIPDGWQIDHLCRNTRCVNPAHLEAVTPRENTMRSNGLAALNARKTHCKRGHEFTPSNTRPKISRLGHPARACRACQREYEVNRRMAAKHAG